MGTDGWATKELDGTWLEGIYSGAAAVLLLRTARVDVAVLHYMLCGDPNAPALTTGPQWGSTPPPNLIVGHHLEWTVTPRGAVMGADPQSQLTKKTKIDRTRAYTKFSYRYE